MLWRNNIRYLNLGGVFQKIFQFNMNICIRRIFKCWFSTYFEVHIFENNHTWPLNLGHCAMILSFWQDLIRYGRTRWGCSPSNRETSWSQSSSDTYLALSSSIASSQESCVGCGVGNVIVAVYVGDSLLIINIRVERTS